MPLNLPNLDDRRYTDLVEEAMSLIPTYSPQWTNHNSSDPGITLIETFAYHTEILLYRLNRITDANKRMFLKLLKGENWKETEDGEAIPGDDMLSGDALMEEIQKTILQFRNVDRAVTVDDFETIALAADKKVARVRCVPRRDLSSENLLERIKQCPGHMSVIIFSKPVFDEIVIQTGSAFSNFSVYGSDFGIKLVSNTSGYLYVGMANPFGEIQFLLSETGSNYSLRFEYYNGTAWRKLTAEENKLADFTVNWAFSGLIQFTPPHDWVTCEAGISGVKRYWVRISTVVTPGENDIAKALMVFPKIPQPDLMLLSKVRNELDDRRLLTTVVHVVGPLYVRIHVRLTLVIMADAVVNSVLYYAIEALWKFFNPLIGGRPGKGWSFGRSVYVSEIIALLDKLPGVDYVRRRRDEDGKELDEIVVENSAISRYQYAGSELESVKLYENELVDITFPGNALEILRPGNTQEGVNV